MVFKSLTTLRDETSRKNREWAITWNETDTGDLEPNWQDIFDREQITYMVWQKEKGNKKGRIHTHCYVHFKTQRYFGGIKKLFPNCHIAGVRSTDAYIDYCKKERTRVEKYIECGVIPAQGSHISAVAEFIKTNPKVKIRTIALTFPEIFIQYNRGIRQFLITVYEPPIYRPVHVKWLYGSTGSGKTRQCFEAYPNLYRMIGMQWWDCYEFEETILWDEFTDKDLNGHNYNINTVKNILDVHKLLCPNKGGFVWANWNLVLVTAQYRPEHYFLSAPAADKNAFLRRIHEVVLVGEEPVDSILDSAGY